MVFKKVNAFTCLEKQGYVKTNEEHTSRFIKAYFTKGNETLIIKVPLKPIKD